MFDLTLLGYSADAYSVEACLRTNGEWEKRRKTRNEMDMMEDQVMDFVTAEVKEARKGSQRAEVNEARKDTQQRRR